MYQAVERRPRLKELSTDIIVLAGRFVGVHPLFLAEARRNSTRHTIVQTLRTVQWAFAIQHGRSVAGISQPDRLVLGVAPREHAARLLETYPANDAIAASHRLAMISNDLREILLNGQLRITEALASAARTPPAQKVKLGTSAPDVLQSISQILAQAEIEVFLISGTLLGAFREKRLLAHDSDLDIGFGPGPHTTQDVLEAFSSHGAFTATRRGECVVVRHCESGITCDVFRHWLRDGKIWHGTLIHEWWNTPFELGKIQLGEHEYRAPLDPGFYLSENYADWQQPVAFYATEFDTPNRVYRSTPEALRFLIEMTIKSIAAGDRFGATQAVAALENEFGMQWPANLPRQEPTP